MARRAKRKLTPRPGWFQAAQDIGCDYSHLRRVLIGERQSKSLTAKFRAWQRSQKMKPPGISRQGLLEVRRAVDFVERTLVPTAPPKGPTA